MCLTCTHALQGFKDSGSLGYHLKRTPLEMQVNEPLMRAQLLDKDLRLGDLGRELWCDSSRTADAAAITTLMAL